jgi:hypothetical protein
MKNLKEFKELIERYESITLKEIEDCEGLYNSDNTLNTVANMLTGFGSETTCSLCLRVNSCRECVYKKQFGCIYNYGLSMASDAIDSAKNPEQLLIAFRNRAKAMRKFAKLKNIEL